jgi:16S rRNA G527 N7-methylase RsmG
MMMGCGARFEEPSVQERIRFLEEYQRDLEQETADVAERIRRLKEAEEASSDGNTARI